MTPSDDAPARRLPWWLRLRCRLALWWDDVRHGRPVAPADPLAGHLPAAAVARLDDLTTELALTRKALADREAAYRQLRLELEMAESQVKVRDVQISALAEVIARDRKRVEAETAIAAAGIRQATEPGRFPTAG